MIKYATAGNLSAQQTIRSGLRWVHHANCQQIADAGTERGSGVQDKRHFRAFIAT